MTNKSTDNNNNNKKETDDNSDVETEDLDHLEPKLRDAWIKMRKLDKKLAQAVKRERQVKLETLKLIEKNRAELEQLKLETDHKESKQEAQNTAHFLALSYIVDLDEEVEKEILNQPMTPLFKTQLPDDEQLNSSRSINSSSYDQSIHKKPPPSPKQKPATSLDHGSTDSTTKNTFKSSSSLKSKQKSEKVAATVGKKDFIKRNIQLAQDIGGTLAMTETEKQRLNELLLEIDDLNSAESNKVVAQNDEDNNNSQLIVEYNPSNIQLAQGDGFTPDKNEQERLRQIETALSNRRQNSTSINSRYSSLGSKNSSVSNINSNTTIEPNDAYAYGLLGTESKQIKLNDDFDENQFGDKFIKEARLTREQEMKLHFIDSELEKLKFIKNAQTQSQINMPDENLSDLNSEQVK